MIFADKKTNPFIVLPRFIVDFLRLRISPSCRICNSAA
jgi:hypothetical protein